MSTVSDCLKLSDYSLKVRKVIGLKPL